MNKLCKKCNIEKTINEFPKTGRLCRICYNEYMREKKNTEKYKLKQKENYENNKDNIFEYNKKYREENKDKRKETCKKYRDNNKEKLKEYNKNYSQSDAGKQTRKRSYEKNKEKLKEYRINNKEHRREYIKNHYKEKRKNDPLFKLKGNISSLIRICFERNGYTKQSRTFEILGCSYDEFKIYLETQFESWMDWDNHGKYTGNYNETWQIDHIIPISNGMNEEEIIKLNHYTNLRPLCSKKNLEKSNYLDTYFI